MSLSTIHETPTAGHTPDLPVIPEGAHLRLELVTDARAAAWGLASSETLAIVAARIGTDRDPMRGRWAVVPGSAIPQHRTPGDYAAFLADACGGTLLDAPEWLGTMLAPRGWGGYDVRLPYGSEPGEVCPFCVEDVPADGVCHCLRESTAALLTEYAGAPLVPAQVRRIGGAA